MATTEVYFVGAWRVTSMFPGFEEVSTGMSTIATVQSILEKGRVAVTV